MAIFGQLLPRFQGLHRGPGFLYRGLLFETEQRTKLMQPKECIMIKLSDDVKNFLQSHLAYIFTVDKEGIPQVTSKGDIAVLDDTHIVFADLYVTQHRSNIYVNPRIAVTVVNPAEYAGYHLKGRAEVIDHGSEYDALAEQVSGAGQLRHPRAQYAIKVEVEEIMHL
jgi:predicted pyridoxine 5'-phosphate oxidase superfamily flavin-nucleotide-binding protein